MAEVLTLILSYKSILTAVANDTYEGLRSVNHVSLTLALIQSRLLNFGTLNPKARETPKLLQMLLRAGTDSDTSQESCLRTHSFV